MISASTAAGLIGGMTQATRELGERWESLPESQREELLEQWRVTIDARVPDAVDRIITSISQHPALAESWQRLDSYIHESRRHFIATIIRNADVTG